MRHLLKFTGTCTQDEFLARCAEHDFWYHSFYFSNGFSRRGDYDIGRDVIDYGFPGSMDGMQVLDIGTGSGWFATYFEQLGATVTTVDVRGYTDFDVYGRWERPDIQHEKPAPDRVLADGRHVYYSPVSKGYWIMKEMLGLKGDYVNARVYDVSPALFGGRTFDLVFMGALLMHVRDPVGALMAARSVCRGRLIANSLRDPDADADPAARMQFINDERSLVNWWRPNRACLQQVFRAAGFRTTRVERTVRLVPDEPYVGAGGISTAADQVLHLVDASV